jgi:hypothetical protein
VDRIAAPSPAPDVQLKHRDQQQQADRGAAAKATVAQPAAEADTRASEATPTRLQVSLDKSAQRFVQVFTDPNTEDLVRRYPSEAQLAYSRAVIAYMRALSESWRDDE